jgi:hypothetical protein
MLWPWTPWLQVQLCKFSGSTLSNFHHDIICEHDLHLSKGLSLFCDLNFRTESSNSEGFYFILQMMRQFKTSFAQHKLELLQNWATTSTKALCLTDSRISCFLQVNKGGTWSACDRQLDKEWSSFKRVCRCGVGGVSGLQEQASFQKNTKTCVALVVRYHDAFDLPLDVYLFISQPASTASSNENYEMGFNILRGGLYNEYCLRILTATFVAVASRGFGRSLALRVVCIGSCWRRCGRHDSLFSTLFLSLLMVQQTEEVAYNCLFSTHFPWSSSACRWFYLDCGWGDLTAACLCGLSFLLPLITVLLRHLHFILETNVQVASLSLGVWLFSAGSPWQIYSMVRVFKMCFMRGETQKQQ